MASGHPPPAAGGSEAGSEAARAEAGTTQCRQGDRSCRSQARDDRSVAHCAPLPGSRDGMMGDGLSEVAAKCFDASATGIVAD